MIEPRITPPLRIHDMPEWKSKILQAVAWLLGFRKEKAYVITIWEGNDDTTTR